MAADEEFARRLARAIDQLVTDARCALEAAQDEGMPSDRDLGDAHLLFDRLLEIAVEQVEAIDLLRRHGKWRPAHAVLRALLETLASIVWILRTPQRNSELFLSGERPNMRQLLDAIGWSEEYERTYPYLSGMVHPSHDQLHMYRWVDFGLPGLFPEITPDGELYVGPDGATVFALRHSSSDALKVEFEPYVALKTFDLAVAWLQAIFGDEAHDIKAWPRAGIERFVTVLAAVPELRSQILFAGDELASAGPSEQLRLE
jgi:hypothetical protein